MSRDLCWNGDLYLHKKLDGMFVFGFASTSKKEEHGMEEEANDYKINFFLNYPWHVAELCPSPRTNIVISMKFLSMERWERKTYVSVCH